MNKGIALPEKPKPEEAPGDLACIHELVAEQVRRTPDAIAVTFEQENLSYAELDRRANQLAQRLRRLGVKPEVPVALYLDRSSWMVVSILAGTEGRRCVCAD